MASFGTDGKSPVTRHIHRDDSADVDVNDDSCEGDDE